jgi:hypothetical protein
MTDIGAVSPALELLVFAGTVIGAFGRTMLPYIQKLKEQEENEGDPKRPPMFQKKYIFTMLYSLAISLGVSMTLFPTLLPNIAPTSSFASIMIISGLAGWGANSIVNNVTTMATKQGAKETAKEPTASKNSIVAKVLDDKTSSSSRD